MLVGALLLAAAARAQTPPPPAADAAAPSAASAEPIGNVATLSGIVTVVRNKNSLPLHLRDDIFLNDQVQTAQASSLGITFNDATTFTLSANAKITIDNYVYEDGGSHNAGLFDIGKGTVAFVAAAVARTGDMKITTPTSTLGIRGTTGLVEVPESGAGTAGAANGESIKLYPDADGHVGRIELSDHMGQRLGALTQGASGFTVRAGLGGARPQLQPLAISPQQAARDQGFVREVHAAQATGRQIITEQRAARRATPPNTAGPNPANRPAQPQRQNQPQQKQERRNQQRQNQQQQKQTSAPNRQGQQKPATTPKPGGKKSEIAPTANPAPSQPALRQEGTKGGLGPLPAPREAGPRSAPQRPRLPAPRGRAEKKRP